MKLALSALLITSSLVAPLRGQAPAGAPEPSAPPTNTQAAGPREPRGPGGFGPGRFGPGMFGPRMEARRADPIPNSPFTGKFTATVSFTDREGKQVQRTSTSTLYRDSQGRIREEFTMPPPPPRPAVEGQAAAAPAAPRTAVVILDPVAQTVTRLNAERKTALVETVPADFFSRLQRREARRESGRGPGGDDRVTRTDLGNKVIGGVSARGERTTITLPASDGDAARATTREVWVSPDAKFEVSTSQTGARVSSSNTLSSFSKAEPDASLFQVPAGYKTETAPERGFGRRHHGPGGPERPVDGSEPPPPPPAR